MGACAFRDRGEWGCFLIGFDCRAQGREGACPLRIEEEARRAAVRGCAYFEEAATDPTCWRNAKLYGWPRRHPVPVSHRLQVWRAQCYRGRLPCPVATAARREGE